MKKIKDKIDLKELCSKYNMQINRHPNVDEEWLVYNHCLIARNRILEIDENTNFMDLKQLYRKLKSDGVLEEVNE